MIKTLAKLCLGLLAGITFTVQAENSHLPIGTFKTREHLIVVSAGPQHILYSVATLDGETLSAGLTREELLAQYPELTEFVNSSIADDASLWSRESILHNDLQ